MGAGTTDLAVFAGTQREGDAGLFRAVQQGKPLSLDMGGDYLDGLLGEAILRDVSGRDRADVMQREAEGYVRSWKERLFLDGLLQPTFRGGVIGAEIQLKDFIKYPGVRVFSNKLAAAVDSVLNSVKALTNPYHQLEEITFVAAGGGSGLPMVTRLATGMRQVGRRRYVMKDQSAAPAWFARNFSKDVSVFPQMAVAIGGAFPKVPGGDPNPGIIRRGSL